MSDDGLGGEVVRDEPDGGRSAFPGEASPRAVAAASGEFHQALPPSDGVDHGELLPAPPPVAVVVSSSLPLLRWLMWTRASSSSRSPTMAQASTVNAP
jgi:hypothetical protein